MKNYVSEKIGSEYESWKKTDIVFLESPTGAGKTHFILHVLLPYAAIKGKRILYFVNRSILKQQLEQEIKALPIEFQIFITIELYQTVENSIRYNGNYYMQEYEYIICDEAHYFSSDSLFNTNTQVVYDWINQVCWNSIRIYISATLDLVKEKILQDNREPKCQGSNIYNFPIAYSNIGKFLSRSPFEYSGEIDYSFLRYHIMNNFKEIPEKVCQNKDKWLIFVDSIVTGKNLLQLIQKEMKKYDEIENNQVIFLTANYKKNVDTLQEVMYISQEQKQSAKVLICTSVMDNGISLKDYELRNIVIQADVKDEFLQMLGRKRFVNEIVDVYLVNKSKEEIQKRKYQMERLKELCLECLYDLEPIKQSAKATVFTPNSVQSINEMEKVYVWKQHVWALDRVVNNEDNRIQKIFYSKNGCLFLNFFSIKRVEFLDEFYTNLLLEMEKDEYALVKQQLCWLGESSESADKIIEEERKSLYQKSWEKIDAVFSSLVDEFIDENNYIQLKLQLKDELKIVIKEKREADIEGADTILNNLSKNDRSLSEKGIEWLHNHCELLYKLELIGKGKGKQYKIVKYESDN